MGSLFCALISFFDARSQNGTWLVRIDDIDQPRTIKGADTAILKTLEHYQLFWDEEVVYQSDRTELYEDALESLRGKSLVFPCGCSRSELASTNQLHQGVCHNRTPPVAWRVLAEDTETIISDRFCGQFRQNIYRQVGDFVVKRKDGYFAYQLATAIDDHEQGITHVVRGFDLLDSTPRQAAILRSLGYDEPVWAHHPLLTGTDGEKLSKQNNAPAILSMDASTVVVRCLHWMGLQPDPELASEDPGTILQWAIRHWDTTELQSQARTGIPID